MHPFFCMFRLWDLFDNITSTSCSFDNDSSRSLPFCLDSFSILSVITLASAGVSRMMVRCSLCSGVNFDNTGNIFLSKKSSDIFARNEYVSLPISFSFSISLIRSL